MAPRNYFEGIFGRSPFKPLQEHIVLCHGAAELVEPLLVKAGDGDWSEVERLQVEIADLESQADECKRSIRVHLPRGFFLPVARADLLDLVTRQDKIANKSKDIAGLVLGRRLAFPAEIQQAIVDFAHASITTCALAKDVVRELDELMATGFSGPEARRVEEMIAELDKSERDSDDAQIKVRAELYEREAHIAPVDVMFMYRVIDWIGDLADHAERVGHRLEMMLAK